MEYRRLGKWGLKVSALSYGSWVTFATQLDEEAARECMTVAYEAGVSFFDNAEAYAGGQAEVIMGKVLRRQGWSRDSWCVSSKVFWGGERPTQRGLSRKHIHDACHAALRRLQVDYLDLFYCHRPDAETPIEETVRAMHDLISQGKVLYWGTSEWEGRQVEEAWGVAREHGLTPPSMEQPQYNMLHRERVERDLHPLCERIGLGLTTWSPLASGLLTGKYDAGVPKGSRLALDEYAWLRRQLLTGAEAEANLRRIRDLEAIAKEAGMTRSRLAIAWCLANPDVSTVILGATSAAQLRENLQAADKTARLSADTLKRIEQVLNNKPEAPPRY